MTQPTAHLFYHGLGRCDKIHNFNSSEVANFECPPFGVVGDGEVGHRIGVRLVGAAQLDVARHDGGSGGDGFLSEEGLVVGPKVCADAPSC